MNLDDIPQSVKSSLFEGYKKWLSECENFEDLYDGATEFIGDCDLAWKLATDDELRQLLSSRKAA